MTYRRPAVHWVLLLGAMQEPGADYSIPHYNEGPSRDLPLRCRPSRHQPTRNNSARPIANIFAPTGEIGGRGRGGEGREGRGERPQGPEGGRG